MIHSRELVVSYLLAFLISLALVTTSRAQTKDDYKRAKVALREAEQAVAKFEECGFMPEAEALRTQVSRMYTQLRKLQRLSERKGGFNLDDITTGLMDARTREEVFKSEAESKGIEPPAKELRRIRRIRDKLLKHRQELISRRDDNQGLTMSAQVRREEAASQLQRARRGGKPERIKELERKVRAWDAYLRRLKGDAGRANRAEVCSEVAEFLREVAKQNKKAKSGSGR
jgi:hypothetical protein